MKRTGMITIAIGIGSVALVDAGHAQHRPGDHCRTKEKMSVEGLPPPRLMKGIGTSALETSCTPRAESFVRQGIALLHCFWDFEALRSFKEAARLDPSCAMAQWGIVQTVQSSKSMKEVRDSALAGVKKLMPKANEHEKYYLRAALKQAEPAGAGAEKTDKAEEGGYQQEMEALIERYPDDVDARLFLALAMMRGFRPDGRPQTGHLYSQLLLTNVINKHPNNVGGLHYWIHAVEMSSRPQDGLAAARKLEEMSARSGHIAHMPGHIYYRVGDYAAARRVFETSVKVDEAYLAEQRISVKDNWNYVHNIGYLIATCAEDGRYEECLRWTDKVRRIGSPSRAQWYSPSIYVLTEGSARARLHLRYGDFDKVTKESIALGVDAAKAEPEVIAYRDGLVLYARGMAALRRRDPAAAGRLADQLEALLWRSHRAKAKSKAAQPGSAEDQLIEVLEVVALDLRGNVASANGDHAAAVSTLERAMEAERAFRRFEPPVYARPAVESLGNAHLAARQWRKARDAFRRGLEIRPRSGHFLYAIARSYALEGDGANARRAYREFLQAWPHADRTLPQIVDARAKLEATNAVSGR